MTRLMYVNQDTTQQDSKQFLIACDCENLDSNLEVEESAMKRKMLIVDTIKNTVLPAFLDDIKKSCLPEWKKQNEIKVVEAIKTVAEQEPTQMFEAVKGATLVSEMPAAYIKVAQAVYDQKIDGENLQIGFLKGVTNFLGNIAKPIVNAVIPGGGNIAQGILGSSTSCGALGSLFNTKKCQQTMANAQAAQTAGQALQQATQVAATQIQQAAQLPQATTNPVAATIQQAAAQEPVTTVVKKETPVEPKKDNTLLYVGIGAAALFFLMKKKR